jgi:alcohol dehydrogenase (cytochrome c)
MSARMAVQLPFMAGLLIALAGESGLAMGPAPQCDTIPAHRRHPDQSALRYGAAYRDGVLFIVSDAGQVLAYEFLSGRKVWARSIGWPRGARAPAAPMVRGGLVITGNQHVDVNGVKAHMYALDARSGDIVWEFLLVPPAADALGRGPQRAASMAYALDPSTGELRYGR